MLERLKQIVYRPDFFRGQAFTANQGMGFYSLAVLVLTVGIIATMLPGAYHIVQSMRTGEWETQRTIVTSLYPDSLVMSVKDGTISTNQANPIVVPVPSAWAEPSGLHPFPIRNLVAIDTDQPVTSESFERYETVAVIGKHDIGFRNPERGEIRIFNLRDADFRETFSVDENLFADWVDRGFAFARIVVIALLFLVPIFLYIGLWIGYLLYSLLGALVVWLAAHIQGHTLRYGRAYLSALYLLPAPFVFSFLMSLTDQHIPFVFTLVLFVMALVNFPKSPKLPAPVKLATADAPVVPKEVEVEEKPSEERSK